MTNNLPTIEEYFARYAKDGYIFREGEAQVKLRNGTTDILASVLPSFYRPYVNSYFPEMDAFRVLSANYFEGEWNLEGKNLYTHNGIEADIIAILNDAGEVIAGEL
jgi:hypothetical protein